MLEKSIILLCTLTVSMGSNGYMYVKYTVKLVVSAFSPLLFRLQKTKLPTNLTSIRKKKTMHYLKKLTSEHQKAHPDCARTYDDSQFSVLNKGRSMFHLQVLVGNRVYSNPSAFSMPPEEVCIQYQIFQKLFQPLKLPYRVS